MNAIKVTAREAAIAAGAGAIALCVAAGVGYLCGWFPGRVQKFGATAYDAESLNAVIQQWSAAIIAVLTILIRNAGPAVRALIDTIVGIVTQAIKNAGPATSDPQPSPANDAWQQSVSTQLLAIDHKANDLKEDVGDLKGRVGVLEMKVQVHP